MASRQVRPVRLRFKTERRDRLTHYLFRYPAKFHPPVAATLIENYTKPGDVILDPFCGSATLLVEARVLGRSGVGLDVDPVATFVADVKTRHIGINALRRSASLLLARLALIQRAGIDYERLQFHDVSERTFRMATRRHNLDIPPIPNIFHWFRKYVVVDLARIRRAIVISRVPKSHKRFFLACFCSIIRNVSNADPVPVSGLEVTAHMKAKEKDGRIIDPFATFISALNRAISDREQFEKAIKLRRCRIRIVRGDATNLRKHIRKKVHAVITSPPYHNAVDYYRRHTLEMYWLGLVTSPEHRLTLLPKYIGRARVPQSHPFLSGTKLDSWFARRCESMMRNRNRGSADAFKHYSIAMQKCFAGIAHILRQNGKVIFVLGKSSWNGRKLPTTKLFEELASPHFQLSEHHWYPLKNRYMTYSRHNNASIDREHVLVFERSRHSSRSAGSVKKKR
jgi:hypothetical protein